MKDKINLCKKTKLIIISLLILSIIGLSSCAAIKDKLSVLRGDLIGNEFDILIYDHYANKTLELEGNRITVGLLENEANIDIESTGFESSVLDRKSVV